MRGLLVLAHGGLLFASCASTSAEYTPPATDSDDQSAWARTIERPFDQVWEALVDHVSGTFFSIDNFEKESGLMTLTFGSAGIAEFVDGGHWKYRQTPGYDRSTGRHSALDIDFDGNYCEYLDLYQAGRLSGRMNLFVRDLEGGRTEVKVRARYVVTSGTTGFTTNTWSFDTGGSDTIAVLNPVKGIESARTLRPTHNAERSIIEAVERIAASK